ncbi:Uncharacterised protein [Bordetella pertussis]|nr:Uncharacterised protein [Bordetella pertussis]
MRGRPCTACPADFKSYVARHIEPSARVTSSVPDADTPLTSAPSLPGSATSMAATSWRVGKRSATTAPARGMTCSTVDSS